MIGAIFINFLNYGTMMPFFRILNLFLGMLGMGLCVNAHTIYGCMASDSNILFRCRRSGRIKPVFLSIRFSLTPFSTFSIMRIYRKVELHCFVVNLLSNFDCRRKFIFTEDGCQFKWFFQWRKSELSRENRQRYMID